MCCGLRSAISYLTCGRLCAETLVEDDSITEEEAVLVPEMRKVAVKIEGLRKQLEEAETLLNKYRDMRGRTSKEFSPSEKRLYSAITTENPLTSFNPFQVPSQGLSSAKSADGMHQRGTGGKIGQLASVIQKAVAEQKYVGGMKLGNWDSTKEGVLAAILGQLKAQSLSEADVAQAINAISRADIKDEFAQLNIAAIWPNL